MTTDTPTVEECPNHHTATAKDSTLRIGGVALPVCHWEYDAPQSPDDNPSGTIRILGDHPALRVAFGDAPTLTIETPAETAEFSGALLTHYHRTSKPDSQRNGGSLPPLLSVVHWEASDATFDVHSPDE